jgi:hypothetical protein
LFVVLKFYKWSNLDIEGHPLEIKGARSVGFLHVYENLEDIEEDYGDVEGEIEYLIITFKEKEEEDEDSGENNYH